METKDTVRQFLEDLLRPLIVSAVKEAMPSQEQTEEVKYYTVQQVCDILHITIPTFYSYVNQGLIKTEKISSRTLVRQDELNTAVTKKVVERYRHNKRR